MQGIFRAVRSKFRDPRWGVFIDRDGVLIEDSGYVSSLDRIQHIPGCSRAIAQLNQCGIPVVIVTNQSGIGRGYFGWEDFGAIQQAIDDHLKTSGAWVDGVWACAYHPEAGGELRVANHPFRKPRPGMILEAADEMGILLGSSWMIGDKCTDIAAGIAAGIANLIRIGGGITSECTRNAYTCPNLAAAVEIVLSSFDR